MLKENDPVVIYETGEVGYVEKILDEGDRLIRELVARLCHWNTDCACMATCYE
jgi:hypothetical protein